MEKQGIRIVVALFLILMGVAALMDTLHILPLDILNVQWFWLVAFGLGGIIFLAVFANNLRENWWAVIPGLTLVGLAILVGLGDTLGHWGGALFLGMIGLSFWVIYLTHREYWWAIIPGGVLVTLAMVAGVGESGNGMDTGGLFFLGLALTFLLLYFVPTSGSAATGGQTRWALWPAGVLGLMGALLLTGSTSLAKFIWPAALILGGGLLVFRAMRPREQ